MPVLPFNTFSDMRLPVISALAALSVLSCGPASRLESIRSGEMAATIHIPDEDYTPAELEITSDARDTLMVTDQEGRQILIMKAVRDSETGEMVATDVLDASIVTARFRNIAERHGKVDLEFEIRVPYSMASSRWQLRFNPEMYILCDTTALESVHITGPFYRRLQLRGYQQYEKFLSSIISDTTRFIDLRNLEIFIQRNIPELYRFRNDTSYVSDAEFLSYYGVSEKEAIDHYTWLHAKRMNERRRSRQEEMFRRYVRAPLETEGVRLDTVLTPGSIDFIYTYPVTVATRPGLRKIDIVLSGDILEDGRRICTMPRTEPLTFYVSSLSGFMDYREKYIDKVIERRAYESTACYIDFAGGKADIDLDLGHNREEIGRIRDNMDELARNEIFQIDSVLISASASPEGTIGLNNSLSKRRAAAVAEYFSSQISSELRSRSLGENWEMLTALVKEDTVLTKSDRDEYLRLLKEVKDDDRREEKLRSLAGYTYMREVLYPRLRTVRFDFHLHRRGMVRDTIHTTELDTVYMNGLKALEDRDYEKALTLLKGYRDYNTAVAYASMDYNASALEILRELPPTPRIKYMLSVLHSRRGDDTEAIRNYLEAVREDRTLIHRGNLDPEIRALTKKYDLDKVIQR